MTEPSGTEPVITITVRGRPVTLLGTAHVSRSSAATVRQLVESGAHDHVAIELCANRHAQFADPDRIAKMDLFKVVREGRAAMVMASLALGAFQQRLAEQFGIEPGAEMRAAIDASAARDLPLHLIDRDIGATLKRTYHSVPWWKRANLLAGLVASTLTREHVQESDIERLKQGDLLESTFQQFAEDSGELYRALIAERDRFMALRLWQIVAEREPAHLLAVVGAGHLKGIASHLQALAAQPPAPANVALELDRLSRVPPPNRWWRLLPWLILVAVVGGFAVGFARSPQLGWQLVLDWVVITGGLAGLGTLIAGGHPLTVVSALLGAPLTTLHPAIGIGMLTALVELIMRRPVVADFGRLRSDTAHWRGWWRNRVSRVLLVFLFSSLGAASGTYIAGLRLFERLAG